MMDPATQSYLQTLIRQEGRSMLQYVGESFPWTTPENESILKELAALTEEERQTVADLVKFLLLHRGRPPMLGAYPMSFTNVNFTSLDHLLPRLLKFQKNRVADLEEQEKKILHGETRAKIREVLESKRRHLAKLEELVARRAGALEKR